MPITRPLVIRRKKGDTVHRPYYRGIALHVWIG